MKKPVDIDKIHTDARNHDDMIRDVMRQFVQVLVTEAEANREPDSDTARYAGEAHDEYARVGGDDQPHISDVSPEGALRKLGREVNRGRSFDGDEPIDSSDPNAILDMIEQAIRDRRAGK